MYKPPAIPPIQNIADKPTRDALLAISEILQVRNSQTDNRFIDKSEFDLAIKNLSAAKKNQQQAPAEDRRSNGGTAASATSLMVKVPTYPVVDPFSGKPVQGNSFPLQSCYENLLWMDSDLAASINGIRERLAALESTVSYLESVAQGHDNTLVSHASRLDALENP